MIKITQKNAKMPKNDQASIFADKRTKIMYKRVIFCLNRQAENTKNRTDNTLRAAKHTFQSVNFNTQKWI